MTNKSKSLIAGRILELAKGVESPLDQRVLQAAAYHLAGDHAKSTETCPSEEELVDAGYEALPGLPTHQDPMVVAMNNNNTGQVRKGNYIDDKGHEVINTGNIEK